MKRPRLLSALALALTQIAGCYQLPMRSPVKPAPAALGTVPYNPPPATPGFPTVAVAEKQLAATPSSPFRHYVLGMAYYEDHRFANAASQFEKAIYVRPDSRNANNLFYLAYSYRALNKPQKALGVFRQILTDKPSPEDASEADDAIANIYNAQQDLVQAKIWYSKSIEQNAHQAPALIGLGCIATDGGNQEEALSYFQRAIKYAETVHSKAQGYAGVGILNEKQGKMDAAARAYSQSLALDRTNPEATQGMERIKQ